MISIVLTTYKREPIIVKRAIDSVLNQTYKNWELFVIDDSPCDYIYRGNVKNAVISYKDKRIKYIALEKNSGACAARNVGMKKSNGDFICFLDDDDVWHKDKLQKQYEKFLSLDEKYGLVYCGSIYYNEKKKKYKKHKSIFKSGNVFDELIMKNFIGGSSFPLIKSKAIKELGGFDEELLACQDLDMWLRISQNYYVDFVDEPLVIYFIHDGEQISTNPKKRLQGTKRKIEKYKSYLELHPKQFKKCLLEYAYAQAMCSNLKDSIKTWVEANKKEKCNLIELVVSFMRIIRYYFIYR